MLPQVSDRPPNFEDLEGSGVFEGSGLFEGSGEESEGSGGDDFEEDDEEGPVYFFLEESTGYMQPTMSGLAILHTVIAFITIIGYNCLKVLNLCLVDLLYLNYLILVKDSYNQYFTVHIRFRLSSLRERRNWQGSWSLMVFISQNSRRMMTSRASGTDWY